MWLDLKKTKSMVVSRARTYALGYGNLTLGGAVVEKLRSLLIPWATFDSKLTFETYLREVVSKATRSLDVVGQVGKLFDCPRVFNRCFNAYVLSNLEYWASV